jgi:hypothetical protein
VIPTPSANLLESPPLQPPGATAKTDSNPGHSQQPDLACNNAADHANHHRCDPWPPAQQIWLEQPIKQKEHHQGKGQLEILDMCVSNQVLMINVERQRCGPMQPLT